MSDCAKACTDEIMPLRVIKVPSNVNWKASVIRRIFHNFSILRFSWIITECRYAVPRSQGIKEAFSTGIPRPITAPSQFTIRPIATQRDADCQDNPREKRPSPRAEYPVAANSTGCKGTHSKCERHRQTNPADI